MRALFVAGLLWCAAAPASAQIVVPPPKDIFSNIQTPQITEGRCFVDEVLAAMDRTHIHCGPVGGGLVSQGPPILGGAISYFAVDTQRQPGLAASVITLGNEALKGGFITIGFSNNAADNPPGCLAKDCRRINYLARK